MYWFTQKTLHFPYKIPRLRREVRQNNYFLLTWLWVQGKQTISVTERERVTAQMLAFVTKATSSRGLVTGPCRHFSPLANVITAVVLSACAEIWKALFGVSWCLRLPYSPSALCPNLNAPACEDKSGLDGNIALMQLTSHTEVFVVLSAMCCSPSRPPRPSSPVSPRRAS